MQRINYKIDYSGDQSVIADTCKRNMYDRNGIAEAEAGTGAEAGAEAGVAAACGSSDTTIQRRGRSTSYTVGRRRLLYQLVRSLVSL